MELAKNAKIVEIPKCLYDERLIEAFKKPEYDAEGRSVETIPAIGGQYDFISDGFILSIDNKSAMIASNLYCRYLDEKAIVWDNTNQCLVMFYPDEKCPKLAFKGSAWGYAMKLKPDADCPFEAIYLELKGQL